jgi:hypothetical protein
MSSPPPGWYPDPWRLSPARWWDGYQWTGQVAVPAGAVAASAAFAQARRADFVATREGERGMARWARVAVVGWGVATALQLVLGIAASGSFRSSIHKLVHQIQTLPPGQQPPAPDLNGLTAFFGILEGGQLVMIAVGIVFLIWQYRAATVAAGLGYPASHSPGLGVGAWFIPVINLWFPYQSLRDCLRPGHQDRTGSEWVWAAFLAAQFLVSVTLLVTLFSALASLIPLALTLALTAFAVVRGRQLVQAIEDDHAGALAG